MVVHKHLTFTRECGIIDFCSLLKPIFLHLVVDWILMKNNDNQISISKEEKRKFAR